MAVEEKKQKWREEIAQVRREIEILKKNVDEFEQIVNSIKTEEDFEKYKDFDVEKGLEMIELH
ncbi:hypothetical protein ACQRCQ_03260 [Lachnospiraceae bacterium SGI.085]